VAEPADDAASGRASWIDEAEAILTAGRLRVLRDVPLRRRTYLGIGGRRAAGRAGRRAGNRRRAGPVHRAVGAVRVPGRRSNLLVADAGPSFVVVSSEGFDAEPVIEGATARVGAGYSVPKLVKRLAAAGLSGLEFAEGIPGSVGGCVRMNAGWHEGAFGQAVAGLTLVGCDGRVEELRPDRSTFAYRSSPGVGDRFVATATLRLTPDAPARIKDRLREYHDHRVRTQPAGARNAGCIFKNPPGDHAGRLIDACGLKRRAVGGASVSEVHANFINRGDATADDVAVISPGPRRYSGRPGSGSRRRDRWR
jgi:UDP-N-acetylmuramate dehydrogenase